jgi:peroxin-3
LAGIQYLFEQGLTDLIAAVQGAVSEVMGGVSLKDNVSAAGVGDLVREVRRCVELRRQNGCRDAAPPSDLTRFMMSTSGSTAADQASYLSHQEILTTQLVNETYDIIHSPDFQLVLTSCLDSGFSFLLTRVSEYFKPVPSGTNGINGIVGLGSLTSLPLAKVIPVMNGLVHTVLADAPNPFIQDLLLKDDVKNFAVNVYNAFCESQPSVRGCHID